MTSDFFYVFNLILSFSTCSQSFKKICAWELLGANVLKRLEEGIHQRSDDHYEEPLPLRDGMLSLTNNNFLALRRLHKLGQRFEDDMKHRDEYTTFMKES